MDAFRFFLRKLEVNALFGFECNLNYDMCTESTISRSCLVNASKIHANQNSMPYILRKMITTISRLTRVPEQNDFDIGTHVSNLNQTAMSMQTICVKCISNKLISHHKHTSVQLPLCSNQNTFRPTSLRTKIYIY